MKTKFDGNQLDTIDVLIGNILNSRDRGDDEDLCMYTRQLNAFLADARTRQSKRAREELAEAETKPETRWIVLESYGTKKINVIKRLRAIVPGLGLREAKTIVESAPIALSPEIPGVTNTLVGTLRDAGAHVWITHEEPQYFAVDVRDHFEQVAKGHHGR